MKWVVMRKENGKKAEVAKVCANECEARRIANQMNRCSCGVRHWADVKW